MRLCSIFPSSGDIRIIPGDNSGRGCSGDTGRRENRRTATVMVNTPSTIDVSPVEAMMRCVLYIEISISIQKSLDVRPVLIFRMLATDSTLCHQTSRRRMSQLALPIPVFCTMSTRCILPPGYNLPPRDRGSF
jgi:hypothetical protein